MTGTGFFKKGNYIGPKKEMSKKRTRKGKPCRKQEIFSIQAPVKSAMRYVVNLEH